MFLSVCFGGRYRYTSKVSNRTQDRMRTRGRIYQTPGQTSVSTSCWFDVSPPSKKRRTTSLKLVVTSARGVRTTQKRDEVSLASLEAASTFHGGNEASVATASDPPSTGCGIDRLHDDLLITILTRVSSTASSPADLINTMLT